MIYFANNPIPHIISASTTAKAIVKIYEGSTLLNEKSLLLSYPVGGKYNFDLSCFFKFYKALQIAAPRLEDAIEYIGTAKSFTVKTYVNDVQIDSRNYQVIAGGSNYTINRYLNQFFTNLPNTAEIQEDERVFRYLYMQATGLTKFFVEAEFWTDTENFVVQELPLDYQEGLYCFDFSLRRFADYTEGKSIKAYRVSVKDRYGMYINVTQKFTIDPRPNYEPVQLLFRDSLGLFSSFLFTKSTAQNEMLYSKSYQADNEENNTYSEKRKKLKLSTKPLRQSEIEILLEGISSSLEIYHQRGNELQRIIQVGTSYLKYDAKEVFPALQLEFQYAKVSERYV